MAQAAAQRDRLGTASFNKPGPSQTVLNALKIEDSGGKGVVYVRRNPTLFAEEEVTIGVRQDGHVAVEGGVKEGEDIVVVGASALFGKVPGRSPVVEVE